jgi:LPXTG-motif cell wall-anchored protein
MKKITVASIVLTIGFSGVAVTSPAMAAVPSMPSTDQLFAIDCDSFAPQLWKVDATNANVTVVGTPLPERSACAGGAQYNPADGLAYFLYYSENYVTHLSTIDADTGAYTVGPALNGDTDDAWQFFITTAGDAFVTLNGSLYSIDLAKSATTLVGVLGTDDAASGYNAVDDTAYTFDASGEYYSINLSTGAATQVGTLVLAADYTCPGGSTSGLDIDSVAFDSVGNAWIQNDGCNSELLFADMTEETVAYVGQFNDINRTLYSNAPYYEFYTETLFITPGTAAPELPNTGLETNAVAGASALLLAAGLLVVVTMRRREGA